MKNSLKITLLCLGAGVALLTSVRADDTPPPPPPTSPTPDAPRPDREKMRERMQERLVKDLALTADQQAKWKSLEEQEHEAVRAVREDTTLSRDQKHPKIDEIRKNFEGQRRAVLTPDQQAKFDELRAKMRERREHRQGQDGPPPPAPAPAPDGK